MNEQPYFSGRVHQRRLVSSPGSQRLLQAFVYLQRLLLETSTDLALPWVPWCSVGAVGALGALLRCVGQHGRIVRPNRW